MDYTSKYTASEIDAKLSQVFESQLQTKDVELSESAEITADEGYLALKQVNVTVKGGGGGDYPEVKPNGWYWKATSAQDSMPIPQRALGFEVHLAGAAIYEALTELNVIGFAESYFTFGRMSTFQEGSGNIVYPPKYVQEAVPMVALPGAPALNSVSEFYTLRGVSEEEFLASMESMGWQRITEEEYMAAKEALNS